MNRRCLICKAVGPWTESRCTKCHDELNRARDARRAPAKRQRYDAEYVRVRRQYKEALDAGAVVTCQRCGEDVTGQMAWDLDHVHGTLHPSHARCNRSAGAK